MTWQVALGNAPLLAEFQVMHQVLATMQRIQEEASAIVSRKRVKFCAREDQSLRVHRLRNARLDMSIRQAVFAHLDAAETKVIVCSRSDTSSAVEIIANAVREQHWIVLGSAVEQQIKPLQSRIQSRNLHKTIAVAQYSL